MKKFLVTGAAGFMGSDFTRLILNKTDDAVIYALDKLTYAGDLERLLKPFKSDKRLKFVKGDICDRKILKDLFSKGIDAVVHFAAESHVDRSIKNALPFVTTNIRGTALLLEAARRFGVGRFVHISTDEVYGEINKGNFKETSPLRPNSPYSASKASAEHFAAAYHRTYGLPVLSLRPSNNYGPWQHPEKLIPLAISRAIEDMPIPLYNEGRNVREWIYVEDCSMAVFKLLDKGKPGEAYNVGSGERKRNIEVVRRILRILGKPDSLIIKVKDRPGHDSRYALDSRKTKETSGWKPRTAFDDGIEKTIDWYVRNAKWRRKF